MNDAGFYSSPNNSSTDMPERVGFGRRFAAVMLDNFIVALVATLLAFTVGQRVLSFIGMDEEIEFNIFNDDDGENTDTDNEEARNAKPTFPGVSSSTLAALTILNSLVMLMYSMVELLTDASPAKRLLGIVVGYDDGLPATRGLLLRRWCLKYGSYAMVLVPVLATLGSIWNFLFTCGFLLTLGAQRQGLHDMAVHSAVFFQADLNS
jgi:hypothetical protein